MCEKTDEGDKMKLWVSIGIGVFIGFLLGVMLTNNVGYKTYDKCKEINNNLIDLQNSCDERVNKCRNTCDEYVDSYKQILNDSISMESCSEILEETRSTMSTGCSELIDELLDENWDTCDELLDFSRDNCDDIISQYQDMIRDNNYMFEPDFGYEPYDLTHDEGLLFVCSFNYYNCGDFNYQFEAQSVMEYCEAEEGTKDIHYLDGDDDGIACEELK